MYNGEVNVKKDDMASLLEAAEFLQIKSLSNSYGLYDNSSCSKMSESMSSLFKKRNVDNSSTDLSPRSSNSPVQNTKNCNKPFEEYPLLKDSFENSNKASGIMVKNEMENVLETEFESSTVISDPLETNVTDDPLSISDCDANDLAGTETNSFSDMDKINSGFKDSLSGVEEAKIPPLKRRKTGDDRYADVSPSKSSTTLVEFPKTLYDNVPKGPIEPVTFGKERNTIPSSVNDRSGFTESLYNAVSQKHIVQRLTSHDAPMDQIIEFFREKGLLKRQMFCDHCKVSMNYCTEGRKSREYDGYIWRCYYYKCDKRYNRKSIRENSPFNKGKLSLKLWLHLLHQYTCGTNISQAVKILGISRPTVGTCYAIIKKLFAEKFEEKPSIESATGIQVENEELLTINTTPE